MFPFQHQHGLGAVEPARVFEFGPIDDNVLVGGAREQPIIKDDG